MSVRVLDILYRTCCILNKYLQKQLYFSFINCYLNYTNIAWPSTNKSKLQVFYGHQNLAARIINFKDKFASAKPILEQINAMAVYEMNIFQTLCFMDLRKNGHTQSTFRDIYMLNPINKYTTRSKNESFKPIWVKTNLINNFDRVSGSQWYAVGVSFSFSCFRTSCNVIFVLFYMADIACFMSKLYLCCRK